ncbi:MAG: demethoxyubiquinone hydroxylase family protein [Alphaproteobacteria bacterium]|nr:demethoxyubiquinone hydroxylase family protein [Alphaproteobacteria bacterium]
MNGVSAEARTRMLRVNHAGEYGAQRIYEGQLAVLGRHALAPRIRHMAAQEKKHLETFTALLLKHNVRPTLLQPLWHVAGFALGAGTALLGAKAAMACTAAVEEVIEGHYAAQAEALGDTQPDIKAAIDSASHDEVAHKQEALEYGAETLPGYPIFKAVITFGSIAAIWLSQRV